MGLKTVDNPFLHAQLHGAVQVGVAGPDVVVVVVVGKARPHQLKRLNSVLLVAREYRFCILIFFGWAWFFCLYRNLKGKAS